MANPSRNPDSSGDTHDKAGAVPDHESITATPRWVKVFGTIALVVVVLFVILHLTGGGPGRHTP